MSDTALTKDPRFYLDLKVYVLRDDLRSDGNNCLKLSLLSS